MGERIVAAGEACSARGSGGTGLEVVLADYQNISKLHVKKVRFKWREKSLFGNGVLLINFAQRIRNYLGTCIEDQTGSPQAAGNCR